MRPDIVPGNVFPDYQLPDHTGTPRKLSELQGDDPLILTLARGHYCPKEHQQHRDLVAFHPKVAVGYTQFGDDLHRRAPHTSGVPRVVRRAMDISIRRAANGAERPGHCGVYRPRAQSDDSAHARAQAGYGDLLHLQRLLVLGPAFTPRAMAGSPVGDTRDSSRLGSEHPRTPRILEAGRPRTFSRME